MSLSDYIDWGAIEKRGITRAEREIVYRYFSPWQQNGRLFSPKRLAQIIVEWSKFFFGDPNYPDHYLLYKEVAPFHYKIYEDLFNEYRYYYITTPSGFGKTTIACLIYPLYRAYYQLDPLMTVGGATQNLSEDEHLGNIKYEIEANDKLIMVYGNLKPPQRVAKWSNEEIKLKNGVTIRALGVGGRIRSRKRGRWRPTLVIIDDPEDTEDIESETVLKKHRRWLKRDVLFRLDKEHGKIRLIGNYLSDECLIANVQKDPRWKGVNYEVLDDSGQSIWEAMFPTAELKKEREQAIKAGELDEWMHERMNRPTKVKYRSLHGYKLFDGDVKWENEQNILRIEGYPQPIVVNSFLGIDPEVLAEDFGPRAFITILVGKMRIGSIEQIITFVYNYLYGPLDPSDVIDKVSDNHHRFHYSGVAIEKNAMQVVFSGYIRKYQAEDGFWRRYPFAFHAIENYRNKVARILRLQPKFQNGFMWIKSDLSEIMDEAEYFMRWGSEGLHLLDALEMADRISYPPTEGHRLYDPIRAGEKLGFNGGINWQAALTNAWRRIKI